MIPLDQPNPKFSILVDYAHEPESMKQLLQTTRDWKYHNYFDYVIHIVSSDGAGRDNWKKSIMGQLSYELSDFSVVTIDNYDERDKPEEILKLLTQHFPAKKEGEKYAKTTNRKEAFEIALKQAQKINTKNPSIHKILIVSTGVGSEKGLTQPGGRMDWDERSVWRKLFHDFYQENYLTKEQ